MFSGQGVSKDSSTIGAIFGPDTQYGRSIDDFILHTKEVSLLYAVKQNTQIGWEYMVTKLVINESGFILSPSKDKAYIKQGCSREEGWKVDALRNKIADGLKGDGKVVVMAAG